METETNSNGTLYESIPYPSYVFPQTGPDRLATLATLHGLEPAPPSRCRYLELGCGDGTNIAAHASVFPGARFVGIDLAANHIERARATASQLGLANTEFHAADILALADGSLGEFDYIVAHGFFSWVPDAVRQRALEIMSKCLSPAGVGYFSFNALPGCRLRQIGWDLAALRTRAISDPGEKVGAAKNVLDTFAKAAPDGSAQHQIYMFLANDHHTRNPENVLHDDLCEINRPFYFLEFVELIEPHGLKYLCEAKPTAIGEAHLSAETRAELDRISSDTHEREQYIDFIDFASFRQSLVCRNDAKQLRSPSAEHVENLFVQSNAAPDADAAISSTDPMRSAFETIAQASPEAVPVAALLNDIGSKLLDAGRPFGEEDRQGVLEGLLSAYTTGDVRLFVEPPAARREFGDKPAVWAFARWQAAEGLDCFTTLLGENVAIGNDMVRSLVASLDGSRGRDAIVSEILGRLDIRPENLEDAKRQLPAVVDANVASLRDLGVIAA